MGKKYYWKTDRWNGGESDDSRIGLRGGFRKGSNLNIHSDTGLLKVNFKAVKDSDTNIDQPVYWIDRRASNGDVFHLGTSKIFKETGGTYSTVHTLSGDNPLGQGMQEFNNRMYYATDTQLGRTSTDYSTFTDNFQTGLTASRWKPMHRYKNMLLIGHGRYVATIDDIDTWDIDRLKLPPGYFVRSITTTGGYAVIVATRGESISSSEEGLMVFWNGTSTTYDDYIPLDGNPHAVIAHKNTLYPIIGLQPTIQQSQGGSAESLITIPAVGDAKTAEVYPGAVALWQGRVFFGIGGGTSTTVYRGIYSFGSKNVYTDKVLCPEISASHGTDRGTDVAITAVCKIGTTLRFAWTNGLTYGVDEVDLTQYAASATYFSLAYDRESPHQKLVIRGKVEFAGALASGESVTLSISPDPYGDADFATSTDIATKTESTVGAKELELPVENTGKDLKSRDLHYKLTLSGSGSTRPEVKRVWFEFDELDDQL